MKNKFWGFFLLGIISISSFSCDKIFRPKEEPTPIPIPTPVPTPTPPNSYDKKLLVTEDGECNLGSKTLFELKNDGTLTYSYNERNVDKTNTIKLSDNELNSVKTLLDQIDVANLSKSDTKLAVLSPSSNPTSPAISRPSPKYDDCLKVENYKLTVNGNETVFDRNARSVTHTTEYLNSLDSLKKKLNEIKNSNQPEIFPYTLPLKITSFDECANNKTEKLIYEIAEDGTFTYLKTENKVEKIEYRRLNQKEMAQVRYLFDDLLLAKLAEQDVLSNRDAIASSKCRLIEYYYINYNNKQRTFGRDDRIAVHSREYVMALDKLKTGIGKLKNVKKK